MLIIFDCDGVLVDSEVLAAEVFSSCLGDAGFELNAAQCLQRFRGLSLENCFKYIERRFGRPVPPGFVALLHEQTRRAFARDLREVSGIRAVLDLLSDGDVSFCVASNGASEKIRHSLEVTDLSRYFPEARRFSAQHVARAKPEPDVFLYAAERCGVPPQFCWVVEDSEAGARAALAAGMKLLLYSEHPVQRGDLAGITPDAQFADMVLLADYLKSVSPLRYTYTSP